MQIMPFEEAAEYRWRVGWARHLLGRRLLGRQAVLAAV